MITYDTQSSNLRSSGNYATIFQNHHDANLVLSALRHQRDLFSGGPALGTHVGSVIHAFENLAYQRQLHEGAEKPYESSKSSTAGKKDSIYKIILPPPPPTKTSTGSMNTTSKQIVRHRPKGKAPDVPTKHASVTMQTKKLSAEENESSAMDSLNLEDEFHRITSANNFPQTYAKSLRVLPPFVPVPLHPTKTGKKISSQQSLAHVNRTNVFLKPTKYSEDDVENDFLRGSTVSQSFIRKSPERKLSTYEQNFLMNSDHNNSEGKTKKKVIDRTSREQRSRFIPSRLEQPLMDEVTARYTEYGSNKNVPSSRNKSSRQSFQPRSPDRAEL